jgi:hypothetical protein
MRIRLFVMALLLGAVMCSAASAGVYVGWKSYGDFCQAGDSKAGGAMSLGLDYRIGLLELAKLAVGLEYSWGDIDYDCPLCKDTSFKHLGARAEALVPVSKFSFTEIYVGGGLSYNWFFDVAIGECDAGDNRVGVHGLAGARVSPPMLPVWFTAEGRYEWLGKNPQITVAGVYLGVGLGF